MEKSVGGKGKGRESVWEATTAIQASSNGSNGRESVWVLFALKIWIGRQGQGGIVISGK